MKEEFRCGPNTKRTGQNAPGKLSNEEQLKAAGDKLVRGDVGQYGDRLPAEEG